jgi:hypothetical protein
MMEGPNVIVHGFDCPICKNGQSVIDMTTAKPNDRHPYIVYDNICSYQAQFKYLATAKQAEKYLPPHITVDGTSNKQWLCPVCKGSYVLSEGKGLDEGGYKVYDKKCEIVLIIEK